MGWTSTARLPKKKSFLLHFVSKFSLEASCAILLCTVMCTAVIQFVDYDTQLCGTDYRLQNCVVLCIVLYSITLCSVLYSIILCIVLYSITLYSVVYSITVCIVLYSITMCSVLYSIILCFVLYSITLYSVVYSITLCIVLYSIQSVAALRCEMITVSRPFETAHHIELHCKTELTAALHSFCVRTALHCVILHYRTTAAHYTALQD